MCGIVGFVSSRPHDAGTELWNALKLLEYRGYDSAGLAVVGPGADKALCVKAQGKMENLRARIGGKKLAGTAGISHTRWATHGRPSDVNAHPHTDATGQIAVVHNGIFENFRALKDELGRDGVKFRSETDTEVLPHLIAKYDKGDLVEAVRKALNRVEGSYAVTVVSAKYPAVMVAARKHSPLVVGADWNGRDSTTYAASDVFPILHLVAGKKGTPRVIYLEDGDMAVLTPGAAEVFDLAGKKQKRLWQPVKWGAQQAQKEGYPHFMLKEIFEQPRSLAATLQGRVKSGSVYLEDVRLSDAAIRAVDRVVFVACGTAHHAGLVGKYAFEELARIPAEAVMASEFRYGNPVVDENTLVVAVTQSGETADTLAALESARAMGGKTLAVCNVVGSSVTRAAGDTFYMHCGPEIGVASTKVYTSMLASLFLLAVAFGRVRRTLAAGLAKKLLAELETVPDKVEKALKLDKDLRKLATKYKDTESFMYIGRRYNFPTAFEAALKMKEISYIHAEGYAGGEMKHGPLALVDDKLVTVAMVPQGATYEKMISNVQEVRARGGRVIAVATEGDRAVRETSDDAVFIPATSEIFSTILSVIPMQLFAYHVAALAGRDVDKPRNLAKSVTVE